MAIFQEKSLAAVELRAVLSTIFMAASIEEIAKKEAREAGKIVLNTREPQDLSPQNAYIRRLQHQVIEEMGLRSSSVGEEPTRRLRIYPA